MKKVEGYNEDLMSMEIWKEKWSRKGGNVYLRQKYERQDEE